MTYSTSYYHEHDRVVSSALSPANDPLMLPSSTAQSFPPPQAPSCSTSQSPDPPLTALETRHVRQTGDSGNMSQIPTSEIPATFSGSSVVSYPHPLALKDPSCRHGKEHTVPLAAFVLRPQTEAGSISDGKTHHRQDPTGGKQLKTQMCPAARLSTDSNWDRACNRGSIYTDDDDGGEDYDDGLNPTRDENALYVLIRLSFLVPPFSILAALCTFFVLLFLAAVSPLRLCPPPGFFYPSIGFSMQACQFLLPLFRVHQRLICPKPLRHRRRRRSHCSQSSPRVPTSLSRHHDENNDPNHIRTRHQDTIHARTSLSSPSTTYSVTSLILIHLLSPLFILPLLFAAWIAAFFWIFATILGNPDGTERKDDGRAAVLGVRNCWGMWLGRAKRRRKREVRVSEAG